MIGSLLCASTPSLVTKELEPIKLFEINQNLDTLMTDLEGGSGRGVVEKKKRKMPQDPQGLSDNSSEGKKVLDVDTVLRQIGQLGPFQIRILAIFLPIFFPISYQALIMVFAAYEPPWMCAKQSESCLESNSSSAESPVYSTATQSIELYERRCTLNRSDWKFAYGNLYEGPHNTIVEEVNLTIRIPFGSLL